jgi:hypothetical protein
MILLGVIMINVIPLNDIIPHQEHEACMCNPKVEYDDEITPIIIIHSSFDGREYSEIN